MRLIVSTFTLLALSLAAPARAAISVNQKDTFEDGSLQSWSAGGVSNPNGPVNVSAGGPAGATDNFLRLTSNGGPSAGGKLVAFNTDQWAGDYLAAGVQSISMQVNNLGNTDLTLRLILNSFNGALGTVAPVNLPAGSGWQTVAFPLTDANLDGAASFADVMSSVFEFNLVHSPGFTTARSSSPNVAAQLGVDNITAVGANVPEPAGMGLAAIVLAGMASSRRRRAIGP
jgi:hypothetical protein